jgi:hypothetical protein
MSKISKVVGCLNCGYRTTDSQEIADWTGCPNCSLLTVGDSPKFPLLDNACQMCGKKTGENSSWIHLSIYGAILPLDYEGTDSQGCWAIGSTCASKIEKGLLTKI